MGGAKRRRTVAVVAAGLMLVSGVPAQASPVQRASGIDWGACDPAALAEVPAAEKELYRCAVYEVPLDHDHAEAGTVDLALMRRSATVPQQRIGTMFINPGGPGGSGFDYTKRIGERLEPAVLDRFDVIGFDPRGVGRSDPLRCYASAEERDEVGARRTVVPTTAEQIDGSLGAARDHGTACAANAGPLLNHMSTKDVARDMDLLRAAEGESRLNFLGLSYGTLLGATYAAMFPDRVRTMLLDGNVDPALRTTDGYAYERQRAGGFELALSGFFEECTAAGARCAFSEGEPRAEFERIKAYVTDHPITLPDGRIADRSGLTQGVAGALYEVDAFAGLARDLDTLRDMIDAGDHGERVELSTVLRGMGRSATDAPEPPPYVDDSSGAVDCADKPFTLPQQVVPALARKWEQTASTFGRQHAFGEPAGCAVLPLSKPDRFAGPWRANTANPTLVVGNRHDPATRHDFAERMTTELGNARLLSVDTYGHCALGESQGVDTAVTDYLIGLTVPRPDGDYQPDVRPF